MILNLSKIAWDKKKKGDRLAVSADRKLEAWKIPEEGIFVVEKRRSKYGQKVLAGPLKALMLLCIMLLPALALAAGAGQGSYGKTLELGGGYYIPNVPDGTQNTVGSFNTKFTPTLDCTRIDWSGQFRQQMNLNLSQDDLKGLGVAAIAGSAKYIASSMMPTWFETVQTALNQAGGAIRMAKADCNSISNTLTMVDPIGRMKKRISAKKAKVSVDNGTTFGVAMEDASKQELHWSFAEDVALKVAKKNPEMGALMIGFLGNVSIDVGPNGSRQTSGTNPAPKVVDGAYGYLSSTIAKPVFNTLTTGENCDKPFRLNPDQAKLIVAQIKEQSKLKPGGEAVKGKEKPKTTKPTVVKAKTAVASKTKAKPTTSKVAKAKSKAKASGGMSKAQQTDIANINTRISNIGDYALSKINGKHYRLLSCDSVQYFKKLKVTMNEYQIVTELTANNLAVDGLKAAIADMRNQIRQLNLTTKDGNGEEIKKLMMNRVYAIEERMNEKQQEVAREEKLARSVLRLRDERQVRLTAASSRARQRANLNQVLLSTSPQDFAADF